MLETQNKKKCNEKKERRNTHKIVTYFICENNYLRFDARFGLVTSVSFLKDILPDSTEFMILLSYVIYKKNAKKLFKKNTRKAFIVDG